jgi:hypothetical protein
MWHGEINLWRFLLMSHKSYSLYTNSLSLEGEGRGEGGVATLPLHFAPHPALSPEGRGRREKISDLYENLKNRILTGCVKAR